MRLKNLYLSLLICAALVFLTQISFAQLRTSMSNQFMAQQMSMNMRMMSNFGSAEHSANSSRIQGAFNEYNYLVKLKDGTTKTVKSYIYIDTLLHKSYLLFVDKSVPKADTAHRKQKIYADHTLSIGRIFTIGNDSNSVVKQEYFTGVATDSCWQFKALSGKITLYSIFSEMGDSRLFDPSTVVGIQYDNGSVLRLEPDALKSFIASDEKAMKYFNKKDYYSAIKKFNKDSEQK
jgi:hypothetical protein